MEDEVISISFQKKYVKLLIELALKENPAELTITDAKYSSWIDGKNDHIGNEWSTDGTHGDAHVKISINLESQFPYIDCRILSTMPDVDDDDF